MPKARVVEASWYDYPQYFDLAFRDETAKEVHFLEAAFRKYVASGVRRVFEPACGTGRLVVAMAARGYDVTGLDLSAPAIDYLERKLARRKLKATTILGDMCDFRLRRPLDAAFCTFNSFRHLLHERDALRHLELVAEHLRPGGIYVLGMHLVPDDADPLCLERWTAKHGRTRLTVTLRVPHSDRRQRLETLQIRVLARTPSRELRLRDEFQLRLYNARQIRSLLAKVRSLELVDVYDFWYEIDEPLALTDEMSDTVFILRKRG